MSNTIDIEDDVVKVDRRRREFRDAGRAQEPIRAEPRSSIPRYDAQAELARAEAFAREIRENSAGLQSEVGVVFNIPAEWIPPGFTYEGKRVEVAGKRDEQNYREVYSAGWRPVPATRHPELCAVGFTGDTIIKNGLMLMERPTVLVKESVERDNGEARRAVQDKEAQLGKGTPGTLTDRQDSRFRAKATISYGPAIPQE